MEIDLGEAVVWFRRAAMGGYYRAQGRLAYLHAMGKGVERDKVTAYAWLILAAAHRNAGEYRERRNLAATKLSEHELTRGRELASTLSREIKSRAHANTFSAL